MFDVIEKSTRAYLREMRSLAVDRDGIEHLVGLTIDETVFYIRFCQAPVTGDFPSRMDTERYLKLQCRHETSRLSVISAESQLKKERLPLT